MATLAKAKRLAVYFQRLHASPPAENHDKAMVLLLTVLNDVEDELSGIPYDPAELGRDGRMYPRCEMFRHSEWERAGVSCYRQSAHATLVAKNWSDRSSPTFQKHFG